MIIPQKSMFRGSKSMNFASMLELGTYVNGPLHSAQLRRVSFENVIEVEGAKTNTPPKANII